VAHTIHYEHTIDLRHLTHLRKIKIRKCSELMLPLKVEHCSVFSSILNLDQLENLTRISNLNMRERYKIRDNCRVFKVCYFVVDFEDAVSLEKMRMSTVLPVLDLSHLKRLRQFECVSNSYKEFKFAPSIERVKMHGFIENVPELVNLTRVVGLAFPAGTREFRVPDHWVSLDRVRNATGSGCVFGADSRMRTLISGMNGLDASQLQCLRSLELHHLELKHVNLESLTQLKKLRLCPSIVAVINLPPNLVHFEGETTQDEIRKLTKLAYFKGFIVNDLNICVPDCALQWKLWCDHKAVITLGKHTQSITLKNARTTVSLERCAASQVVVRNTLECILLDSSRYTALHLSESCTFFWRRSFIGCLSLGCLSLGCLRHKQDHFK